MRAFRVTLELFAASLGAIAVYLTVRQNPGAGLSAW